MKVALIIIITSFPGYPDGRGSSHQQQISCYGYKDINNWWIVKRPDNEDLKVVEPVDVIKHGDIIQLGTVSNKSISTSS